jgi:hypothetical protein
MKGDFCPVFHRIFADSQHRPRQNAIMTVFTAVYDIFFGWLE